MMLTGVGREDNARQLSIIETNFRLCLTLLTERLRDIRGLTGTVRTEVQSEAEALQHALFQWCRGHPDQFWHEDWGTEWQSGAEPQRHALFQMTQRAPRLILTWRLRDWVTVGSRGTAAYSISGDTKGIQTNSDMRTEGLSDSLEQRHSSMLYFKWHRGHPD